MRTSDNTTSTTDLGPEAGDRDLLADLQDESPRPRGESIFTVIEHGTSSPLVVPPELPRPKRRKSKLERLKKGESLALTGLVLIYVVVLSMTMAIGIAQHGAKRATQKVEAPEAGLDVSASPPDIEPR